MSMRDASFHLPGQDVYIPALSSRCITSAASRFLLMPEVQHYEHAAPTEAQRKPSISSLPYAHVPLSLQWTGSTCPSSTLRWPAPTQAAKRSPRRCARPCATSGSSQSSITASPLLRCGRGSDCRSRQLLTASTDRKSVRHSRRPLLAGRRCREARVRRGNQEHGKLRGVQAARVLGARPRHADGNRLMIRPCSTSVGVCAIKSSTTTVSVDVDASVCWLLTADIAVNRVITKRQHPLALRPLLPEIAEFARFNHEHVLHTLLRCDGSVGIRAVADMGRADFSRAAWNCRRTRWSTCTGLMNRARRQVGVPISKCLTRHLRQFAVRFMK